MTYIKWSDRYSVGIEEIDHQHQQLFEIINQFYANVDAKDAMAPQRILKDLLYYVYKHFRAEEKYFEKFGYSATEAHKRQHKEFESHLAEFQNTYQKTRSLNVPVVSEFLKKWLVNHVLITDRKYISCFKENGLK